MSEKAIKITIIGAVINVLLSSTKIIFGIIGHSKGLVADGLHSLSDLLSDIVVFFGIKIGNKPSDETHNYGHKKIENLSEIILGFFLIISAFYIGFDAAKSIYLHQETHPAFITIIIALFSVISKEILFFKTIKIGQQEKNTAVIANAWHHRSDSFSSIAVLTGLLIAYFYPDLHMIDSYMGIAVSFIIVKIGVDVIFKSTKRIIDTAPPIEIQKKVFKLLKANKEVLDYHNVRMRYIGNEICIEMHIMVNSGYSIKKAHDISDKIEKEITRKLVDIYDVTIHIEPYITKTEIKL